MTDAVSVASLQQRNAALTKTNTDLCSANEALVLAGARYLLLHDLAPTPLVTVDTAGRITDVNHAAEVLLGSARPQVLDRQFAAFLDARHELPLSTLFTVGSLQGLEVSLSHDGAVVDLSLDAVVLPGIVPARALLACVDITARKIDEATRQRAREQAQEAHRLESLGVLAGGVAHTFNNLMTVVIAGTDHVLSELAPGSSHLAPLTEACQAARNAALLAHQMLAYAGRIRVPVQPLDLGVLVRDLEPLIRASVRSTPVILDLPPDVPFIAGDAQQLRQLVLQLATNAAEAMAGRPGSISISVRSPEPRAHGEGFVCVEVRDQGAGMSPATRARIFEPYFSTKCAGRGLGLAVVHGVVRAHGGKITVTSDVDRGTQISIALPALTNPPLPAEAPSVNGAPSGGTVLVVDDDETVRSALKRALTRLGYKVLLADSGLAALDVMRTESGAIQLLVTDLTMPEMNGTALARCVRAAHPDLPIILISGYGEMPPDSAGLFVAAMSKPFELAKLREVVRAAVARAPR